MLTALLKSKLGLWVTLGLLLTTIFFLARETYQKYVIDNEVKNLQTEIFAVEGKNKEILELINYYKTTEYKERQARSILGLAKPGEFVVALPPKDEGQTKGESSAKPESNLKQWWNYFFK